MNEDFNHSLGNERGMDFKSLAGAMKFSKGKSTQNLLSRLSFPYV